MANRSRIAAQRVLRDLRRRLGAMCAWCWRGSRQGVTLEFDCIAPEGHQHHKWETNRRAYFYRRLFLRGGVQLLCSECHAKKTRAQQDAENAYNNIGGRFRPTRRHLKCLGEDINGDPIWV